LLERCVTTLLLTGCRDIAVAVSRDEPDVGHFLATRCSALARPFGAAIHAIPEEKPLGTIGVATSFKGRAGAVLVLNGDNLISIDLPALIARHVRGEAALTIATHYEPFRIPFGEVSVAGGRVTAYVEKPERRIRISSGVYVLSQDAIDLLPPGQRADVPWLVERLLARGASVLSFPHKTPWIDVNDVASLERAERLVGAYPEAFERGPAGPDREMACVVVNSGSGVLLARRPEDVECYAGLWTLPMEEMRSGGCPREAIRRVLRRLSVGGPEDPEELAVFDDIDCLSGLVVRHHVHAALMKGGGHLPFDESRWRWLPPQSHLEVMPLSTCAMRCLAIWNSTPRPRGNEPS
jgi:mannose-1-phosphate guanylyltransferase/phosphomannomutase